MLIVSITGFAQTDTIRGKKFGLKGKIINKISRNPDCGDTAYRTVIEFEIIEFTNVNYESDSIAVIITCPEFYDEGFFESGKTYTLALADENQSKFGWSIPNDSIFTKYNLVKKL